MFDISYKEALDKMMSFDAALHLDTYYWIYSSDLDYDFDCSLLGGCAIISNTRYSFSKCDYYDVYRVHQISDDCNVNTVIQTITDSRDKAKDTLITVSARGGLPIGYEEHNNGYFRYYRYGEDYLDSSVKELSFKDYDIVKAFADSQKCETKFNEDFAGSFYNWFDKYDTDIAKLLGIFDGDRLVGLLDVHYFEQFDTVILDNLLVAKSHRQQGYATRLVRSALSLYPDKKYVFYANLQNPVAISLVHSLGFKRFGYWISIDIDAKK